MRFACLAFFSAALACAQSFQGSLRGRVVDRGGSAAPSAKISLVDEGTAISRATLTTADGEYTFAAVNPSTYTVVAEAPGFKRMERRGLVLATQAALTVDLSLELGQVTEQVNVTAESPLMETANASTGQVIDSQKLLDPPNLGRNPFMMSKLSQNVVQVGNPKFNRMQDQSGSSQILIAGGPVRGNNYLLDGIAITDSTNRAVIIPWSPKTTVRGGYGMFWAPIPFSLQDPIGYTQATPIVASNDNNFTPAVSLDNPFPSGLLKPVGNSQGALAGIGQAISVYDSAARSTLVQQYSLDVQRQLPMCLVLAAGYVGSKSTHLVQGTGGININQLDPALLSQGAALNQQIANPMAGKGGLFAVAAATLPRSQLRRPYPQFTTVTLNNSDRNSALYHSFYLKVQKRMSNGFSVLSTYTWSQNRDGSFAGAGNTFNAQPGAAQNNYDLGAEYGLSTSNTPHRWSSAITYELPFGQGRAMLSSNRFLDLAVGGWSINAIGSMQAGFPLAISQINNNGVIGASVQRPNATGLSPVVDAGVARRLDGWLNPAAFSQAPQFTFGNLSRTIGMRGPGQVNWDVSVFKTFAVGEKLKAQFRAEALNFTNTPSFNGPNTTFGNPQLGRITSQANFSRMVQLGARFFL